MPTEACPTAARLSTPIFMVLGWDGPGAGALRERDLDDHLRHVEENWRSFVVAGPLREPDGEALIGSMLLVMAPDEAAVKALLAGDPYFTNGQFARLEIKRFTASIGEWVGGKIWSEAGALRHRAAGGPVD